MPRKLRQFAVGEIYHIINRGVEKRKIFMKPQDYSRFILGLEFFNRRVSNNLWALIAEAGPGPASGRIENERKKKTSPLVELMAFTLMPNHYHLIVREITKGGISLFMVKMGGFSTYFNKQYERVGPLFQSRYKAVHIKNENQLSNVFVYVHTNPVELKEPLRKALKVSNKQNAVNWLETYRWSSYHDYVGNPTFPHSSRRNFFLELFGGEVGCRQAIEDWISFKAENSQLNFEEFE